jgi:anti-sigma factor RsiW
VNCRTLIEFLMAYLDGELPDAERAQFEAHLAECPWCVAYLKTYQETVRLGKAVLTEPEAPPPPEELVRAVLAARALSGGSRGPQGQGTSTPP